MDTFPSLRVGIKLHSQVALALSAAILLVTFWAERAEAQLSTQQLKSNIDQSRLVPKGATCAIKKKGDHVLLEILGYPSSNPRDKRIDAILLTRHLVESDPANIKTVVTRYLNDANAKAYTEAIVSNIEITGASAGATNSEELLDGVMLITVDASDSADQRCAKYTEAAVKEIEQGGLHEAEHLFASAASVSPSAASQSDGYGPGMLKLASAYKHRGDNEEAEQIYKQLADTFSTTPAPSPASLNSMREIGKYFRDNKDFKSAEALAAKIVSIQDNQNPKIENANYADDLLNLATCHRNLEQLDKAKAEINQALEIRQGEQEADSKAIATLLEELGDCFASEKNTSRAIELYNKSKNMYDTAAASKGAGERIPYEIYRSVVNRLNSKISNVSAAPQ